MSEPVVNGPGLWLPAYPWPKPDGHKQARGGLVVVSGPAWSTGAARMAARAGLRIGAGLVTVLSPPDALAVNAAHLEAVMLAPFDSPEALARAAAKARAAVIGPAAGVGEGTRANLAALAAGGRRLVVDADAITSFADDPAALFARLGEDDVLTPHEGEFERLFPGVLKAARDRTEAARRAAAMSGATVLLKGERTVIATAGGDAVVNAHASAWLATAGAGDVLAGMIGGLLAQGMPTLLAAAASAWLHGDAARDHGPGLIAEDLPGLIPAALRRLQALGGTAAASSGADA